jgi:uncharacterized membrane protein
MIVILLRTYACVNGDTWSSEIGILSRTDPILITTCRRVSSQFSS